MFLPQKQKRDVLVRYPNHAIEPGEEGEIIIQYYTADTGPFSRTVELYSNASDKPERLTVRGTIKNIYSNALTACPSFRNDEMVRTSHYNVVVVADRATGDPITGARIELFERSKRRSVSLTSPQGQSTNRVERGKYLAVVTKDGYRKAEQELFFEKGTGVHVVYLDRDEPYLEEERVEVNSNRWEEPEPRSERRSLTKPTGYDERVEALADEKPTETETADMGIGTNNQWEENPEDAGIGLNDQWDEAEELEVENEELKVESEALQVNNEDEMEAIDPFNHQPSNPQPSTELDLGISTNDQWEDELVAESAEPKEQQEEKNSEPSIEEKVEAALAEADKPSDSNPELSKESEPEFSVNRYRPNNVLLLLDVSGSMKDDGKMEKLKSSIRRMIMMLRDVDVLTMIAYNSTSWEVLSPTAVKENQSIVALVDSLKPFGYTNGVKGMETAYQSLETQLIKGGNNQLIIATDGKFNSSKFSERDAIQMVKSNSDKGIVLSIIGFGDDKEAAKLMRKLAKEGNGNFLQVNKDEDPTELLAEEIKQRSKKI